MSRMLALATSIIILVFAANMFASVPALATDTDPYTCDHMSKKRATQIFRREDGSPSKWYEWEVIYDGVIKYEGPMATGRIPRDFHGIVLPDLGGREDFFEGKVLTASRCTVVCWSDPGTAHTKHPPRSCPTTKEEAVQQIGGRKKEWHKYFELGDHITWHYRSRKSNRIGRFTVPYQAYVMSWGAFYTPGYSFKPVTDPGKGTYFHLECFTR